MYFYSIFKNNVHKVLYHAQLNQSKAGKLLQEKDSKEGGELGSIKKTKKNEYITIIF